MTDPQENSHAAEMAASGDGGEWTPPRMEEVPRPTYWPVVMALGTVFLFWGVVTTVAISVIGLGLFILALAGWIREMCHAA
jgi:hypothetical protein